MLSAGSSRRKAWAYSRLLCSLNAMGASGSMMVLHAFLTSTLRMAFFEIFLVLDFAPRVATNLSCQPLCWESVKEQEVER